MGVELTKELIERVATAVERELAFDLRQPYYAIAPLGVAVKVRRLLTDELTPLHTLVFNVRGKDRDSALKTFFEAACKDELGCRTDITLLEDRPYGKPDDQLPVEPQPQQYVSSQMAEGLAVARARRS